VSTANSEKTEKVTFALVAFNQERFIRDAIGGALAQTYSPLEIVLSDDCSSDRTFQIMEEMAAAYRGPHKLILNRNRTNAGLGGHLNKIMALSTGDIIVIAAGDDISLPERTARQVDFLNRHPDIYSVWSSIRQISETGELLQELSQPDQIYSRESFLNTFNIIGSSHAWRRELWTFFGDLQPGILYEDGILGTRSSLLGKTASLSEVLVQYRVNARSISSDANLDVQKITQRQYAQLRGTAQLLLDHVTFGQKQGLSQAERFALIRLIHRDLACIVLGGIIRMPFQWSSLRCYFHALKYRVCRNLIRRKIQQYLSR